MHDLDAARHRTGHVWHVEVRPAVIGMSYLWRVGKEKDARWVSNECLDPWARCVDSSVGGRLFNRESAGEYVPWGVVMEEAERFEWEDVRKPRVAWKDMIVYEIHVRGFTRLGGGGYAGSFLGVVERIPYLKALGVNVVELLPVMEFNEREWGKEGGEVCQYWGYSTVSFFALMNRYGRDGGSVGDVVREFKYMVRELHRAGIEVIMDVVYNHTAEMGNDYVGRGFYGMKILAPFSYYLLRDGGKTFVNHSGCGNTMNCNNVVVQELICESLRYWAHEMGVDGFRFDLASVLCRGTGGEGMEAPPVIERMTKDPAMRDVKLIAEPWDVGGLYQVGRFPHYGAWAEWNGKFRDCVRRFIKGDRGMVGEFATRLCGSQDLYGQGRKPYHSINFVTAHDGFSMYDLVSYNEKHNERNGEGNRDGEGHNNSWNCGVEGESGDGGVVSLRRRQMKNFMVALLMSAGTPMVRMGDEYGHTQGGNNNGWCQDSGVTWFDWERAVEDVHGMLRFTRKMVWFRRKTESMRKAEFLSERDVEWHGTRAGRPEWGSEYNFVGAVFKGGCELFVAFNAGGQEREVELPRVSGGWERVVDSQLESPEDFAEEGERTELEGGGMYRMGSFSCLVLRQTGGGGGDGIDGGSLCDAFSKMEVEELF